jgi:hypothetical protein
MDFPAFSSAYPITSSVGNAPLDLAGVSVPDDFRSLIEKFGGCTFGNGLYRILRGDRIKETYSSLVAIFPEYANRILPFGFDWLGRHFALDFGRMTDGAPTILLLDVGFGEALHIPANLREFHETELVEHAADAVAEPFFEEWQGATGAILLGHDQCAGYKIPPSLGGLDEYSNLEAIDLEVYLHFCGELRGKAT